MPKKRVVKAAYGGKLKGASHERGGIKVHGANIELEGDEFIVNKESAKKFEKDLKKNEHVGGFVPQKQIDKFNLERKGKNPVDRFLKKYTDFYD